MIDNNAREVTQRGYIEDWRGRRRRFPKAIGKDFDREMSKKTTRAFDWEFRGQIRQITNAKVQGGAATQTKEVMIAQSKLMKNYPHPVASLKYLHRYMMNYCSTFQRILLEKK